MKLVVISPERAEPREPAVLGELFAAGLERYHVRKPDWPRADLDHWLRTLPAAWRPRLVLHQHHDLVAELGLGGRHWRDNAAAPEEPSALHGGATFTSRSCHALATVQAALGHYDAVLFAPVFPSISKPGHGPRDGFNISEFTARLSRRTPVERRTAVIALGGVTPETAPHCRTLGFDGVAVLGALWQAAEPVSVFRQLRAALSSDAT